MDFKIFKSQCIETDLNEVKAFTFSMKVKDIVSIYYVAVRGVDKEDGAVQRPLSSRRISDVTDYILKGNSFFNTFILNWTEKNHIISVQNNVISFALAPAAAQAIDGQHRLAGLEQAMARDSSVGERNVIVTLCDGLTTSQAATIFLNINTEQKPVPKSLLYDLFGETNNDPNHVVNRASDIAVALNDDLDSPLYKLIKFPGAPRGVGRIELSTFVTAMRPGLDQDGEFRKRKLENLDHQVRSIKNYFSAIRDAYDKSAIWDNATQNPFLKAAGFNGAVDFFFDKLILKCAEQGSFSVETIKNILQLDPEEVLTWDDLKGQDGKTARKNVALFLEKGMTRSLLSTGSYAF